MNESMLTISMRGKMEMFDSISTSCATNNNCQSRIQKVIDDIKNFSSEACEIIERYMLPSDDKNHITASKTVQMLTAIGCKVCICIFCYADRQQKYQKGTRDKLTRNGEFLSVDRESDELPTINPVEIDGMKPFRYEAMGDLINSAHARNYIRMMYKNPDMNHSLFTKNPNLVWEAVKELGKPKNAVFVYSSSYVNVPEIENYERYNKMCMEKFGYKLFDRLFTVWTANIAHRYAIEFNCCGANGMKDRKCKNCLNCYKRSGYNEFVNELLR